MIVLQVCIGSACHLKGSYNVISAFQQEVEERGLSDKVEIKAVFCLGKCTEAVSVKIGDEEEIYSLCVRNASEFFDNQVIKRIK